MMKEPIVVTSSSPTLIGSSYDDSQVIVRKSEAAKMKTAAFSKSRSQTYDASFFPSSAPGLLPYTNLPQNPVSSSRLSHPSSTSTPIKTKPPDLSFKSQESSKVDHRAMPSIPAKSKSGPTVTTSDSSDQSTRLDILLGQLSKDNELLEELERREEMLKNKPLQGKPSSLDRNGGGTRKEGQDGITSAKTRSKLSRDSDPVHTTVSSAQFVLQQQDNKSSEENRQPQPPLQPPQPIQQPPSQKVSSLFTSEISHNKNSHCVLPSSQTVEKEKEERSRSRLNDLIEQLNKDNEILEELERKEKTMNKKLTKRSSSLDREVPISDFRYDSDDLSIQPKSDSHTAKPASFKKRYHIKDIRKFSEYFSDSFESSLSDGQLTDQQSRLKQNHIQLRYGLTSAESRMPIMRSSTARVLSRAPGQDSDQEFIDPYDDNESLIIINPSDPGYSYITNGNYIDEYVEDEWTKNNNVYRSKVSAKQSRSRHASGRKSETSDSNNQLNRLMAKLDQDNKILAELDKSLMNTVTRNPMLVPSSTTEHDLMNASQQAMYGSSAILDRQLLEAKLQQLQLFQQQQHQQATASGQGLFVVGPTGQLHSIQSIANVSTAPVGMTLNQQLIQQQKSDLERLTEQVVDSIEIPNRGRCKVFIAKYSYDPFKQSPNENPESELTIAAGDFLLVFGEMDDDGFFFAELLDGRRGLVPSNFVTKLTGEDLFEFQARVLYGSDSEDKINAESSNVQIERGSRAGRVTASGPVATLDTGSESGFPPEFYDVILNDAMGHTNFQHLLAPEDFHRMNDYVELAESADIDEEDLSDLERAQAMASRDPVPPPKRLIPERQLHKSILIGWLHPDCPKGFIESYQIYVDGVLKCCIPSNERTKALVEGVDSSIPHRISVRAVTTIGRMSKDAACTIVIGKNVPFAPCCVKATNITSESSLISWLPCNSNFYHVVAVNSVEVKTVGPSIYKHLITGLSANTLYRVSVRAKPGKLMLLSENEHQKTNPKKMEMLTTFVDFRTLPKSLPDPPVDVQVESGPQEGTLLVTWLPVTLDTFGTSHGCPVTGYAVFAAHKKLAEIDSPTGDHALLDVTQIESFHKKAVTVRTKSGENLSQDSMPCEIPDDLIKFQAHRKYQSQVASGQRGARTPRQQQQLQRHIDQQQQSLVQQQMMIGHQSIINPQTGQHVINPQTGQPLMAPNTQPQNFQQRPHMMSAQGQMVVGPPQGQTMGPQGQMVMGPQGQLAMGPQGQLAMGPQGQIMMGPQGQMMMGPQGQMTGGQQMQSGQRLIQPGSLQSQMQIPSIEITRGTPALIDQHSMAAYGIGSGMMTAPPPSPYGPSSLGRPMVSSSQLKQTTLNDFERQHFPGQQGRALNKTMVRWFVALYDYDPLTMSPNPDGADEELPFREGDLIKVYGDKDADGFYRGELAGRYGYVPCNMVSEVQQDPVTGLPVNDVYGQIPAGSKKMIALYDYDPQELSPNPDAEMELAFMTGDVIYVFGEMDEDGFYMGELNGVRGLVPSNFLTEAPLDTSPHHRVGQTYGQRTPVTGAIPRSPLDQQRYQQQQHQLQAQFTGHQAQPGLANIRPGQMFAPQQPAGFQQQMQAGMLPAQGQSGFGLQQPNLAFGLRQQRPNSLDLTGQQQTATSSGLLGGLFGAGKKLIGSDATAQQQQQQQIMLMQQQGLMGPSPIPGQMGMVGQPGQMGMVGQPGQMGIMGQLSQPGVGQQQPGMIGSMGGLMAQQQQPPHATAAGGLLGGLFGPSSSQPSSYGQPTHSSTSSGGLLSGLLGGSSTSQHQQQVQHQQQLQHQQQVHQQQMLQQHMQQQGMMHGGQVTGQMPHSTMPSQIAGMQGQMQGQVTNMAGQMTGMAGQIPAQMGAGYGQQLAPTNTYNQTSQPNQLHHPASSSGAGYGLQAPHNQSQMGQPPLTPTMGPQTIGLPPHSQIQTSMAQQQLHPASTASSLHPQSSQMGQMPTTPTVPMGGHLPGMQQQQHMQQQQQQQHMQQQQQQRPMMGQQQRFGGPQTSGQGMPGHMPGMPGGIPGMGAAAGLASGVTSGLGSALGGMKSLFKL